MATVIASQATISGTFSMTKQAIALGFLPRMRVLHTSESEIGQIYIPAVNWLQLVVVLLAVVGFGSSDNLAAAYGIAVTATMLSTTILTFFVIRYRWKMNLAAVLGRHRLFPDHRRQPVLGQLRSSCSTAAGSRCCWARSCSPSC